MALRIGNRVFDPGLLATATTLVLVLGLASLGRWQLARMHEKEALFAAFDAGTAATLPLSALAPERAQHYQHVAATGSYDSAHQVLLDNMTHDGRAGYHVVTPFAAVGGETLLVNRGWVPLGDSRDRLPDVKIEEGARTIEGRLGDLPAAGIALESPPARADAPWPRVLSFPKLSDVAAALDRPLAPWVLLLDRDQPDGFVREWRPATFPAARHLGYAVTWFALALTLIVIYVAVNLHRTSEAR